MARTIRFHLDECCDPAIADGLRRRSIDVTTSQDSDFCTPPPNNKSLMGLLKIG